MFVEDDSVRQRADRWIGNRDQAIGVGDVQCMSKDAVHVAGAGHARQRGCADQCGAQP